MTKTVNKPEVKTKEELDAWVKESITKINSSRKSKEKKEQLINEVFNTASEISATLQEPSFSHVASDEATPTIKKETKIPTWFPSAKKFTPTFTFLKDYTYTFAGEEREVKKLKLLDTVRLAKKFPSWFNYLAMDKDFSIDIENLSLSTAVVLISNIVSKAMSDFDLENNCPGVFMLSVCDEIANLMGYDDITLDNIVTADVDEVYNALVKIWGGNSDFFTSVWRNSGVIHSTTITLAGIISRGFKTLKTKADLLFSEEENNVTTGTVINGG